MTGVLGSSRAKDDAASDKLRDDGDTTDVAADEFSRFWEHAEDYWSLLLDRRQRPGPL